jgi:hypothetical protein
MTDDCVQHGNESVKRCQTKQIINRPLHLQGKMPLVARSGGLLAQKISMPFQYKESAFFTTPSKALCSFGANHLALADAVGLARWRDRDIKETQRGE